MTASPTHVPHAASLRAASGAGSGLGPVVLSLPSLPGASLRAVSPFSVVAVQAWFQDRVHLLLGRSALPLLARWRTDLDGGLVQRWEADGPGRSPEEQKLLVAFLREQALAGTPFSFSALLLEPQGGRSYPFLLPDYTDPVTISQNKYEAASGPRLLLSAIRRDVRALLRLPAGWALVPGDFKSCHPAIALALTGDAVLAEDLMGDIHQITGDRILNPEAIPKSRRRDFGKWLNLATLFGLTETGFRQTTVAMLSKDPGRDRALKLLGAWWERYPALCDFRDRVIALVDQTRRDHRALVVVAPSGKRSVFSPAQVAGHVGRGPSKPAPGPDHEWRTVFSAIFRTVEGDLLWQTISNFHATREEHGGRLVLPIYDGIYVAAPAGEEDRVWTALSTAGEEAAKTLGITATRMERKR